MASLQNIQSNAYRGDFLRNCIDKTIDEIHDDIVTVFGPCAQDAFLTVNAQPYYTRDGKETLRTMKFDNELSMYVLKIMYQAVERQARVVGDGTTTLSILYTNLYRLLRKENPSFTRKEWEDGIREINENIMKYAETLTKENMLNMFYTCTQDMELSQMLFDKLADAILEQAYIDIRKSNIESDLEIHVINNPILKATKQYTTAPIGKEISNAVVLYCNGSLDIVHPEVLLDMMCQIKGTPRTIVILCNGITNVTRETIKSLNNTLNTLIKSDAIDLATYNTIAIFTLDEYRSYSNEMIEDISTMFTDEVGFGGLVNPITFESLLYQAFHNPDSDIPISELETFDHDAANIQKIRDIFFGDTYQIDVHALDGIRVHKDLGEVSAARYKELIEQIETEKSEVARISLRKRLKTVYGKFIDVEVGSKLIKDSQRKFELILDAITSAHSAVEHGIFTCNSILLALRHGVDIDNVNRAAEYIIPALAMTLTDMIMNNVHIDPSYMNEAMGNDEIEMNRVTTYIVTCDIERFDATLPTLEEIFAIGVPDDVEYPQIVEPSSIMTTLLENTTVVLDLYNAQTVHLDSFLGNYI